MVPPELANTTFAAPAASAPSTHVERADHIDLRIELGTGDRHPHVGLGREVKHDIGFAGLDQIRDRGIANVDPMKREAAVATRRASARLARLPEDRSSATSTDQPSASSRSASVDPMKPAPPVMRPFTSFRPPSEPHLSIRARCCCAMSSAATDAAGQQDTVGDLGAGTDRGTGSDHAPNHRARHRSSPGRRSAPGPRPWPSGRRPRFPAARRPATTPPHPRPAGARRVPAKTSRWASKYLAGVPMSSQ